MNDNFTNTLGSLAGAFINPQLASLPQKIQQDYAAYGGRGNLLSTLGLTEEEPEKQTDPRRGTRVLRTLSKLSSVYDENIIQDITTLKAPVEVSTRDSVYNIKHTELDAARDFDIDETLNTPHDNIDNFKLSTVYPEEAPEGPEIGMSTLMTTAYALRDLYHAALAVKQRYDYQQRQGTQKLSFYRPRAEALVYKVINDEVYVAVFPGYKNVPAFPGGGIDEGESPEVAARRETREEAGLQIKDLKPIYTTGKLPWESTGKGRLIDGERVTGEITHYFQAAAHRADKKLHDKEGDGVTVTFKPVREIKKQLDSALQEATTDSQKKILSARIKALDELQVHELVLRTPRQSINKQASFGACEFYRVWADHPLFSGSSQTRGVYSVKSSTTLYGETPYTTRTHLVPGNSYRQGFPVHAKSEDPSEMSPSDAIDEFDSVFRTQTNNWVSP